MSWYKEFKSNNPRHINGIEAPGWCGLEGEGYIADVSDTLCVVVDVTEEDVTLSWYTFYDEPDSEDGWGWVELTDNQKAELRSLTIRLEHK